MSKTDYNQDKRKVNRFGVRCICGDSIVIKTDNPQRYFPGMNVSCGSPQRDKPGCGLNLGRLMGLNTSKGYIVRLIPSEELKGVREIPEPARSALDEYHTNWQDLTD